MSLTIPQIQAYHKGVVRRLILDTLQIHRWGLRRAARALDVAPSTLQCMIGACGLGDAYAQHAHGPGRPRTR